MSVRWLNHFLEFFSNQTGRLIVTQDRQKTTRLAARAALLVAVAMSMAACGKDKAPTGQVVATVDGDEITLR
ncbi:MAG TPA: hypothetical protein VFN88_10260, partial [Caulobacteraceae bacterium]|nr:hypothetical protein [Caulobacteraceae bacterium]